MKHLYLLALLITSVTVKAQMVRQPLSVRYAGLGAYSKNYVDPFSATSNIASLANLKAGAFGAYGERRFVMQELNQYASVVAMPTTSGTFSVHGDYFGFSDFNESQVGIGYARKLGNQVDLGVKFNYHMVRVAGYGSASAVNFEIGTIFHLTDRLHSGVHVYNPLSSKLGKNSNEKLASIYRIGLGYEVSEKVFVTSEIVKQEDMQVNVNAGLQYNVQENLFIRGGVSTATNNSYLGVGVRMGLIRVDVNTAYHPQLGFTPGVLLLFNFKKVE